ncbi:hypothetical protein [Micromonospora inyonensis]|nr:hypothetical protein [Micromonospora inyonensis]
MAEIITGAAGSLVAYSLNGQVDAVRGWVGKIFKAGSKEEQSLSLRSVESDAIALSRGQANEADVKARWAILLASHVAEHPEALQVINDLASRSSESGAMVIGVQRNEGSGIFIGRDMSGNIGEFDRK